MKKLILMFLTIGLIISVSSYVYGQGFTNQSFKGNYATVAIYGDDEGAGVGVMNPDGNGNASGNYSLNGPGFITMKRTLLTATVEGTYTVNSDGMCSIEFTLKLANGMSLDETGECVITQADDNKLATGLFCMVNEPLTMSRGFKRGGIITMTLSRLPD